MLSTEACLPRGPFLESPETFRAHFGWRNSLCIFKTKASRGTKLWSYFNFYSLYNIWKDQPYRISGSEFCQWFSGLSRNGPQVLNSSCLRSLSGPVARKPTNIPPYKLVKYTYWLWAKYCSSTLDLYDCYFTDNSNEMRNSALQYMTLQEN